MGYSWIQRPSCFCFGAFLGVTATQSYSGSHSSCHNQGWLIRFPQSPILTGDLPPYFPVLFLINRESERCLTFKVHSTGSSEFGEWLSYPALAAVLYSFLSPWGPQWRQYVSVVVNCLMASEITLVWGNRLNSLGLTPLLFLASTFPTLTESDFCLPKEISLFCYLKREKQTSKACPFHYCGKLRSFPHKSDRGLCFGLIFGFNLLSW